MRIGIDISQLAYPGTGVANYLKNLVENMIAQDNGNDYILFYSSLRKPLPNGKFWKNGMPEIPKTCRVKSVVIKQFRIPPTALDIIWNKLHVVPIETLIGQVDVFLSSDWTQPPSRAKKATILYDLIVYTHPEETHNQVRFNLKNFLVSPNIVSSQKSRLQWVKKEVDAILCISEATKKDAIKILHIPESHLSTVYPGL